MLTLIIVAYLSVALARSGLPAPRFWAEITETVESSDDGTRNNIPISFSTIPTAAASSSPRLLAIMVIIYKRNLYKSVLKCNGNTDFEYVFHQITFGFKSFRQMLIKFFRLIITVSETITLTVCDNVVPSAAPAVSKSKTPIKR